MSPARLDLKRDPRGEMNYVTPPVFEDFLRRNLLSGTPLVFGRQVPEKPLLVSTPDTEMKNITSLWRVLLKFTGDTVDYRRSKKPTTQQSTGSVMTRLIKTLCSQPVSQSQESPIAAQKPSLQATNAAPRVTGMLRRISNRISHRFSKSEGQTLFDALPLTDTLLTQLEMIQYITGFGILKPRLRDEIYMIVCKQLRRNPYSESLSKLWLLMYLVASCFTPSTRCLPAVVSYLEASSQRFAQRILKILERTEANGTRVQPVCSVELEAARSWQPIILPVHLMEGKTLAISVDGASTAEEVCDYIVKHLHIKESFGFHLIVSFHNKTASLGRSSDRVLDSLSLCEQMRSDLRNEVSSDSYQLHFRKELFSPFDDTSGDSVATSLIYEQIKCGVARNEYYFENEYDFAEYLACVYYIEYGADLVEYKVKQMLTMSIGLYRYGSSGEKIPFEPEVPTPLNSSQDTLQYNSNNNVDDERRVHLSDPVRVGRVPISQSVQNALMSASSQKHSKEGEHSQLSASYKQDQQAVTFDDNNQNLLTFAPNSYEGALKDQVVESFKRMFPPESWPNTFTIKQRLIEIAREKWSMQFSRYFDVNCAVNGTYADNVSRMAISNSFLRLLDDNNADFIAVDLEEILQVEEQKRSVPHNSTQVDVLVIVLLGGVTFDIVSKDKDDIKDLLTYLLHELLVRSKYAIVIDNVTAQHREDVDAKVGDLVFIQFKRLQQRTQDAQGYTYVKNLRTGAVGVLDLKKIVVIPTQDQPSTDFVSRYTAHRIGQTIQPAALLPKEHNVLR